MLPMVDSQGKAVPGAFGREKAGSAAEPGARAVWGCTLVPRLVRCCRLLPRGGWTIADGPLQTQPRPSPPNPTLPITAHWSPSGRRPKRVERYEGGEKARYYRDDDVDLDTLVKRTKYEVSPLLVGFELKRKRGVWKGRPGHPAGQAHQV